MGHNAVAHCATVDTSLIFLLNHWDTQIITNEHVMIK